MSKHIVDEAMGPQVDSTSSGDSSWRWELFKAEYASLREESARAHDSQHHIVQWSLTAYGALFLAALALTDKEPIARTTLVGRVDPYLMQLGFFLVVLPLLVIASMLVWLAELYRIERAGAYLRFREACWRDGEAPDDQNLNDCLTDRGYPLLWETKIHGPAKELRNFSTGFVLYAFALVFALVIYFLDVSTSHRSLLFQLVAYVLGVGVLLLYFWLIPRRFKGNIEVLRQLFPRKAGPNQWGRLSQLERAFYRVIGLRPLYADKGPAKAPHGSPPAPNR